MPGICHINPDHYLETEAGRIYTPERSAQAWKAAYAALDTALRNASSDSRLYLVIGAQGAGKSTWIKNNQAKLGNAFFFDAALPKAIHRAQAIDIAKNHHISVVCVWISVPLDVALHQNAMRKPDHRVPEDAIRSVCSMFEPPHLEEGFARIEMIDGTGK